MNILAIDLGKFNSMSCFFDTNTQEHSFLTAATTRVYLTTVLRTHQIDLVVMEACGPSGWISDLCQEHGLKTLVCSSNEEAWRWRNVKRKTDKDDALKLARLTMMRYATVGRQARCASRASDRRAAPTKATTSNGLPTPMK